MHQVLKPIFFIFCLSLFSSCVNSPVPHKQPDWVRDPYSKYNKNLYIAAVGNGRDRQTAEKNAFTNLSAFFGQSIQEDQIIINTYYEVLNSGTAARWSENTAIYNEIQTSVNLDFLAATEIGEVWFDDNVTYYAIAVMNKTNAILIYSQMLRMNLEIIKNLININQSERNTLESFSRFQLAANIAEINITYANILTLLGSLPPNGITNSNEYRLEAQNITRSIPIAVRVTNDKSDRIQAAFANILSGLGFRSGGIDSRYELDVNIVNTPVNNPDNPFIFSRMELNAKLIDTYDNTILLSYNFSVRDGHYTIEEAENRTYILAERRISDEYQERLSGYLSQLLPVR